MKIAFYTESMFEGIISRTFENMRTEYAWECALEAYHYPLLELTSSKPEINYHDIAIIILPKKVEILQRLIDYNFKTKIREFNGKIGFMQEGPHWLFQDFPIVVQLWYFDLLQSSDFLLVHNSIDKKYYSGLFPEQEIVVNSTLMIEDAIGQRKEKEDKCIVNGNWTSWYGGFDSMIVARYFDVPIFAPSMGRMKKEEAQVSGLNHLPYMYWKEWMTELSGFKFGVNMMRTVAAGTISLNSAYLSIPVIGNSEIDTQRICFPETSILPWDLSSAISLAKKLKNDKHFYETVSEQAFINWKEHFSENIYLSKMNEFLESL